MIIILNLTKEKAKQNLRLQREMEPNTLLILHCVINNNYGKQYSEIINKLPITSQK